MCASEQYRCAPITIRGVQLLRNAQAMRLDPRLTHQHLSFYHRRSLASRQTMCYSHAESGSLWRRGATQSHCPAAIVHRSLAKISRSPGLFPRPLTEPQRTCHFRVYNPREPTVHTSTSLLPSASPPCEALSPFPSPSALRFGNSTCAGSHGRHRPQTASPRRHHLSMPSLRRVWGTEIFCWIEDHLAWANIDNLRHSSSSFEHRLAVPMTSRRSHPAVTATQLQRSS